MEFVVMAVLFFVIMVPLVLGILIPLCRDRRKAGGGVVNCDAMMRRFVYRVELSFEGGDSQPAESRERCGRAALCV